MVPCAWPSPGLIPESHTLASPTLPFSLPESDPLTRRQPFSTPLFREQGNYVWAWDWGMFNFVPMGTATRLVESDEFLNGCLDLHCTDDKIYVVGYSLEVWGFCGACWVFVRVCAAESANAHRCCTPHVRACTHTHSVTSHHRLCVA